MLSPWYDYRRTFALMDDFRRRIDRLFADLEADWRSPFDESDDVYSSPLRGWPRIALSDAGDSLVVRAEVPGLSEKDITIKLNQNVLSLAGTRRSDVPEGYVVHRKERPSVEFSRSFTLPCKVDPDNTTASIKDGILTVTMRKAPEAQPRQITVSAQ
jgi:HSP20 family protein